MNQIANINLETGIHYGVIHQNKVIQAWADDSEENYGDVRFCPHCEAVLSLSKEITEWCKSDTEDDKDADYFCISCRKGTDDPEYPPEPLNYSYNKDGYEAICDNCGDYGDIFVTKSPYYTETKECSPCFPNAGDLSSPDKGGLKTYCFGYDWFENNEATYPIYRVDDDSLVPYPGCNFLT